MCSINVAAEGTAISSPVMWGLYIRLVNARLVKFKNTRWRPILDSYLLDAEASYFLAAEASYFLVAEASYLLVADASYFLVTEASYLLAHEASYLLVPRLVNFWFS